MNTIRLFTAVILLLALSCKKTDNKETPAYEDIIEIKTSFGTMHMWLYKQTPLHRKNFLDLTRNGFFDSTTFHRIISGFVIQGGDPNSKDTIAANDGSGGPGYTIPAEITDSLTHKYGAVGAARDNNPAKASNGSQFYIVVDPNGEPGLNKNYTVFGMVFSGMDIAKTIAVQPKDTKDRPKTNILMDVNIVQKTAEQLKSEFGFIVP